MNVVEYFLLFYVSYKNSARAKLKGQNGILWAIITCIAFILIQAVGSAFVLIFYLKDRINFNLMATDMKYKDEVKIQLLQEFSNNPWLSACFYGFGFGGYLVVRYILDQKNNKNIEKVHWTDRINNN